MITFRHPIPTAIDQVMANEHTGFSLEEATTIAAMIERIIVMPDSFFWAVTADDFIAGYVVGPILPNRYTTGGLFGKSIKNQVHGGYQSILSLAVAPAYRVHGVASQLLAQLKQVAQFHKRKGITLFCLKHLVPFNEKKVIEWKDYLAPPMLEKLGIICYLIANNERTVR